MLHIFIDVLRNAVLITGLVVVMMMMIESLNIESGGRFFAGLRRSRLGQILFSAFLGVLPGCMGGFASVSLYTHRMISFGALIAMMIASSGDEAFVMLAMIPGDALWIFAILFIVAIVAGYVVDLVHDRVHGKHCHKADHSDCGMKMQCDASFELHGHLEEEHSHSHSFTWKRLVLLLGLAAFVAALGTGRLEHDHTSHGAGEQITACEAEHDHAACVADENNHASHGTGLNLLDEKWMNILFSLMGLVLLLMIIMASDHFVEEHMWKHVVVKHLPRIFLWTFGVLGALALINWFWDLNSWIEWLGESRTRSLAFTSSMIVLATLVGIIPDSGPHMVFVSLYAAGIVPLPVLVASCISQDGHASIPLLAESKQAFLKAKAINCLVALLIGFLLLFIA